MVGSVRSGSRGYGPQLAASVVLVGLHGALSPGEPRRRYPLAAGCGIVHGVAFGGALRDLGTGGEGSSIVVPALSFNLGVVLGQLAIVGLARPLVMALQRRHGARGVRWASLLIAALGSYALLDHGLSA